MENQEPRSRARLAASIVLLVVIGASLIAAAYLRTGQSPISASFDEPATPSDFQLA